MDGPAERLWALAGKLHPMVVHFPIALLVAAAVFEFVRLRRGKHEPSSASVACVTLGTIGAAVAVASGWSAAERGGGPGVEVHRWLAVAAGVVGLVAIGLGGAGRAKPGPRLLAWYRLAVVAGAMVVSVAAHFGGEMVWGQGYLWNAVKDAIWGAPKTAPEGGPVPGAASTRADGAKVDFVREVFPILSRKCFSCHVGEEHKSGFALDTRAGLLKGGDSGEPGMVPGDAAKSLIIKLVSGEDPDRVMPPRGERLTAEQIKTLRAWIDQGAPWAEEGEKKKAAAAGGAGGAGGEGGHWHWAYQAPKKPDARTIDELVRAKLDAEKVKPAPEADKATLLRRLSLDLTGLPPTPEEVDAFVSDASSGAYEREVDRLLASPRYGERWARVWLDLARYADTHGYEKDSRRVMWPYRDWVIDAYNRDLPFDRFTIDQLAGDLEPDATLAQRIATGFNRNTQINEEGGTDPEEFRIEAVMDRVNTVSSVWLGTTLACAQCHDHKYDPLTQKDYFRFLAFLNQDEADAEVVNATATEKRAAGPMVDAPRLKDMREYEAREAEAERRRAVFQDAFEREKPGLDAWLLGSKGGPHETWETLKVFAATAADGVKLDADAEGVVRASGANPERSVYTVEGRAARPGALTGLKLEVMPDEASGACGRSSHGNFLVSEIRVEVVSGGLTRKVELGAATATSWHAGTDASDDWQAWLAIDGRDDGRGWTVHPKFNEPQSLTVRFATQASVGPDDVVRVKIVQNWGTSHTLAKFRIATASGAMMPLKAPEHLAAALGQSAAQRSGVDAARLEEFHVETNAALETPRRAWRDAEARAKELVAARTFVMGRAAAPRATHVFIRGSFLSPGEEVTAGVPGVLAKSAGEAPSQDRLGLAKWLVDPKNPLTARVQVNRLWATLFGRGLVETEEDFGTQGEAPANQPLLDYLAARYVEVGWSQKRLLREIVMSAAYKRSSTAPEGNLERDPYNRLLARGPRFRVEAEMIRDIALSASGLLSGTMFGESVFPPQPPGVWTMIYSADTWVESKGEDRFRRGLYTFARRTAPYPTFAGFDAPSREVVCTRRPRTNTPLQALTTMNDPQFVEAAGALAVRMMREGRTVAERARRGLRLAIGRTPTEDEVARLARLATEQTASYAKTPEEAEALCAQIPGRPSDLRAEELAAWTVVANVILNLDETVTKS